MVVLGGWAVSYARGTHVVGATGAARGKTVQGYLAHEKELPPLGLPLDPR